jgi:hypothetical protein
MDGLPRLVETSDTPVFDPFRKMKETLHVIMSKIKPRTVWSNKELV